MQLFSEHHRSCRSPSYHFQDHVPIYLPLQESQHSSCLSSHPTPIHPFSFSSSMTTTATPKHHNKSHLHLTKVTIKLPKSHTPISFSFFSFNNPPFTYAMFFHNSILTDDSLAFTYSAFLPQLLLLLQTHEPYVVFRKTK